MNKVDTILLNYVSMSKQEQSISSKLEKLLVPFAFNEERVAKLGLFKVTERCQHFYWLPQGKPVRQRAL